MTFFLDLAKDFIDEKLKEYDFKTNQKNSGYLGMLRGTTFSVSKIARSEGLQIKISRIQDKGFDHKNLVNLNEVLMSCLQDSQQACKEAGIKPETFEKDLGKIIGFIHKFYELLEIKGLLNLQPQIFTRLLDFKNYPKNYANAYDIFYYHVGYFYGREFIKIDHSIPDYLRSFFISADTAHPLVDKNLMDLRTLLAEQENLDSPEAMKLYAVKKTIETILGQAQELTLQNAMKAALKEIAVLEELYLNTPQYIEKPFPVINLRDQEEEEEDEFRLNVSINKTA